ncbi:MAG TPA: filamentous hemagglutinin N-terminal domain-containing protein, partial [Caulobacteraceae bacterium]|nr:filamentous hemagglutinin N-terminal domain-containing protein [Caulobacteraceae bacterium]
MGGPQAKSRARRSADGPIFGLTLGALISFAGVAAAAPALPTGGQVAAGTASIARSSASSLTIDQSSARAIVDWSSFSIGQGGTVRFDNGAGATLNRVTGGYVSSIDGLLSATGSVYLINPNGVIVGKDGVVDTGGTFAASTQDLTNASFMTGGTLTFSGSSTAAVLNLGRIGALGGDVARIASKVENDGTITAAKGDVGLAAGYQVTLSDATQNDGKFQVLVGGSGTSATNTGSIQAAEAELRANGGNVYALAGNTGGIIDATGVSTTDGKVLLIAEGGTVTANGTIAASGAVETSGASVNFAGLTVKAASWLVDPTNLTVDSAAATSIDDSLNAGTNVTLQTTASGSSGPGVASSGAGDIIIAAPVAWKTASTLTLDAYHSIDFEAAVTVERAGQVVLVTDDGGTGGGISFADSPSGFTGSLSFTDQPGDGQSLTIDGAAYTLIYTMKNLIGINTAGLGGDYALAKSLDASGTTYTAGLIGSTSTPFTGAFTGLGHTISNLTIDAPTANDIGLFAEATGSISGLGLVGGSVSGESYVGDLVGYADAATIANVFASGAVTGSGSSIGGLVGDQAGDLTDSFATGAVVGDGPIGSEAGGVGGLVGESGGTIANSYATGTVTGNYAGGLVGESVGEIENSYATGAVSGNYIGGLVGGNGATIMNSYATGAVSASSYGWAGGLAAYSSGAITGSYATGAVSGGSDSDVVGGLVG